MRAYLVGEVGSDGEEERRAVHALDAHGSCLEEAVVVGRLGGRDVAVAEVERRLAVWEAHVRRPLFLHLQGG